MKSRVLDAIRVVGFALIFSAALIGFAKIGDYTKPALAQNNFTAPGNQTVPMSVNGCLNGSNQAVPCSSTVPLNVTQVGTASTSIGSLSSQYPAGAIPITASATGTTGATAATLAANATRTTFICGFSFFGTNATTANTTTNITVTGTVTGTLNFGYTTLAAAATVPDRPAADKVFSPCVPGSAINTAVVVNGPALGAGATLATVTAWGYQL